MGASDGATTRRRKGSIETLPSGARRVIVYAGIDPVTKRRHYLKQTIPAGTPKIDAEAEKLLRRLQVQVDERRQPRTNATVKELVTRHLELARLEETTARRYRSCFNTHILPLLGSTKVGAIDADVLDSFYAELQRCRLHCDRRPFIEHRTDRPRLRLPLPAPSVQAAVCVIGTTDPLHPQRSLQTSRQMAMGSDESDQDRRAAGRATAEPQPTDRGRSRSHRRGRVQ